LQRITEHFASSALSIQQSRAFDAKCIIVTGCLTAVADAIVRRIAIDEPSAACSHLSGRTVTGRQMGTPGFGLSVANFATQSETLEIYSPELVVARSAVLDYFLSPQQRRLEKIFTWEDQYHLKPTKPLIKYIRMVCREVALPAGKPSDLLLDVDCNNRTLVCRFLNCVGVLFLLIQLYSSCR
jgi:hypothetical protein